MHNKYGILRGGRVDRGAGSRERKWEIEGGTKFERSNCKEGERQQRWSKGELGDDVGHQYKHNIMTRGRTKEAKVNI